MQGSNPVPLFIPNSFSSWTVFSDSREDFISSPAPQNVGLPWLSGLSSSVLSLVTSAFTVHPHTTTPSRAVPAWVCPLRLRLMGPDVPQVHQTQTVKTAHHPCPRSCSFSRLETWKSFLNPWLFPVPTYEAIQSVDFTLSMSLSNPLALHSCSPCPDWQLPITLIRLRGLLRPPSTEPLAVIPDRVNVLTA